MNDAWKDGLSVRECECFRVSCGGHGRMRREPREVTVSHRIARGRSGVCSSSGQAFGVHGERKRGSGCVEFASRMSWKVRLGEIGHGNGRTRQNLAESCECRDPVCRSVRSLACWLHWAAIPDAIGFIPCSIPDWRASYDAAGCRIPGWLWNAI
jgi:hypothetical protein